jgi:hypothetical protein
MAEFDRLRCAKRRRRQFANGHGERG